MTTQRQNIKNACLTMTGAEARKWANQHHCRETVLPIVNDLIAEGWFDDDDDVDDTEAENCPGCGCGPGDGHTETCFHPAGCGFFKDAEADGPFGRNK